MSQAISKWEDFQHELKEREREIASQLPSNVSRDRFINAAIAAVKQDPSILLATPRSLFSAVTKAAQDGLLPDGREGVITVYNQKLPKPKNAPANYRDQYEKRAQWNPMVHGLRKRSKEIGDILIDAQVVYEQDEFDWQQGDNPSITHKPAKLGSDRGQGIGAYAIFKHPTQGILHREVMDWTQIEATREQSRAKDSLMWTKFWTEGWRKAVIRRGVKAVPVTPELERVLTRDDDNFDFNQDPSLPPPTTKRIAGEAAPEPPSDDEIDAESTTIEGTTLRSGDTMTVEQTLTDEGTHFKVTTDRVTVTRAPEPPVDEEQSNYTAGDMPADTTDAAASDAEPGSEEWFGNLEYWSESAYDTEALESVFKDLNAHSLGQGTRQRKRAQEIYDKHIARINRRNAEAAGQKSFLEDMPEETRQAVKNGNTP